MTAKEYAATRRHDTHVLWCWAYSIFSNGYVLSFIAGDIIHYLYPTKVVEPTAYAGHGGFDTIKESGSIIDVIPIDYADLNFPKFDQ